MGVAEEDAALRGSVDVRGLNLRMPIENADPVIEVVDSNEQHVRLCNQLVRIG